MTDVKVPLMDFAQQARALEPALRSLVDEVFRSQQFILGAKVRDLETRMAAACGAREGIGVASGSDALYLALLAAGVGPGDEVITTPFTFFATAGAVWRTGAKPVFADVDADTYNLSVPGTSGCIGPRTRAIIPVHLFGLPAEMDELAALARPRAIRVIEDAAQATGAAYKGRPVGSLGDAACLSFFPTKNLGGAGDGGMVITSDAVIAEQVRVLRTHGAKKKYFHEIVGINSRLDELQAAVLLAKMPYLDAWNSSRRRIAARYLNGFKDLPLRPQAAPSDRTHVYHLFSFTCDRRDELASHLQRSGIGCGVYYPSPLHLQKCFEGLEYKAGDCPVAERLAGTILSIPMYPELADEACDRVIAAVRAFYGK
jgi:dTDP-4-amino-4,6-dideoxygalactose transaminase